MLFKTETFVKAGCEVRVRPADPRKCELDTRGHVEVTVEDAAHVGPVFTALNAVDVSAGLYSILQMGQLEIELDLADVIEDLADHGARLQYDPWHAMFQISNWSSTDKPVVVRWENLTDAVLVYLKECGRLDKRCNVTLDKATTGVLDFLLTSGPLKLDLFHLQGRYISAELQADSEKFLTAHNRAPYVLNSLHRMLLDYRVACQQQAQSAQPPTPSHAQIL